MIQEAVELHRLREVSQSLATHGFQNRRDSRLHPMKKYIGQICYDIKKAEVSSQQTPTRCDRVYFDHNSQQLQYKPKGKAQTP